MTCDHQIVQRPHKTQAHPGGGGLLIGYRGKKNKQQPKQRKRYGRGPDSPAVRIVGNNHGCFLRVMLNPEPQPD